MHPLSLNLTPSEIMAEIFSLDNELSPNLSLDDEDAEAVKAIEQSLSETLSEPPTKSTKVSPTTKPITKYSCGVCHTRFSTVSNMQHHSCQCHHVGCFRYTCKHCMYESPWEIPWFTMLSECISARTNPQAISCIQSIRRRMPAYQLPNARERSHVLQTNITQKLNLG